MNSRLRIAAGAIVLVLVAAACAPPVATEPPPGATGPSNGCGVTTRGPVTDRAETVRVGNSTRRYTITVPPAHTPGTDAAVPLVLDFHGLLEGWAGTHPFATQFSAKAKTEGFAVAYPVGSNDGVNWDVTASESNRDLRFVDALLAQLGDELCIDQSRIYVTGLSYGAFMTSMLMCMRPNTFAAAAPVAGIRNFCHPTARNIPFVTFHGTTDWILPYPIFADTPAAIAGKYGCSGPPSTEVVTERDRGTGGSIVREVWDCAEAGTQAESYVLDKGGHSWPGSEFFSFIEFIVGTTATSLDATEVIWDFFSRHRL